MPDTTLLWLIPAVLGWTEALKSQFPKTLAKVGSPFIALGVASLLYIANLHLTPVYFGLLYAVGSTMGLYTGVKLLGGSTTSK